tara:strand:- start:388 stop:570 length:183 start_codon:yes stop_codon:yes gene_type:complete
VATAVVQVLLGYGGDKIVSSTIFRILVFSLLLVLYLHFASSIKLGLSLGSSNDGFQRVEG